MKDVNQYEQQLLVNKAEEKSDRIGITNEQWQAITSNDISYDNKFYYGVKTTGIFCRPSCKSRPPIKKNVKIFNDYKQALEENFRPCKRCKPTDQRLPAEEWVEQITEYIDINYGEHLTLQILADLFHGSPYHMQRTFKRVKGQSPTEYIQHTRIKKAIEYLDDSDKQITEIADSVGIPNLAYFVTLFKQKTGYTPTEYRQNISNKGDHNDEYE
ncbi:bifunctional transcriptional activator/DNA repair enzyme AdaA [Bacillus subtilis]|uniref:bifunctional transcriptional activator/DNA repair enzyme AdaA n=1 Tax=Bacillus subtilis TaxID=1423 RepID=UPI0034558699